MRAVVQRVSNAHLTINRETERTMGPGLVILVGFEGSDEEPDIPWLTGKISRLRIFDDSEGVMNVSISDMGGDVMVISQFTLHASTRKGNRPSYVKAAHPEKALTLYHQFILQMEADLGKKVLTGEFGAHMQVNLTNDGPVTILIDTKNRE
jgi:D-tyrosyl-tRNA(Tyr) deacylase